jgi:hypothetical protein
MATVVDNAFKTQLFQTTYQDMANVDWEITLYSTQTLITGLSDEDTLLGGNARYVSYTVPQESTESIAGTTAYYWKDSSENIFREDVTTLGDITTSFESELTAGVDYVDGTETYHVLDLTGYTHSAKLEMLDPGLEMAWKGSNEKYTPIVGSSASATFFLSPAQADIFDSAILTAEGNFQVVVKKDGEVFWYGYALPETISSAIDEGRVEYDVTFTDGLGMLSFKDWVNTDGTPITGKISMTNAIALCLKGLPTFDRWKDGLAATYNQTFMEVYGSPQPIRDEVYEVADVNSTTTVEDTYEDWNFQLSNSFDTLFFMAPTMRTLAGKIDEIDRQHHGKKGTITCGDVLKNILTAFGMEICLFNGHWQVYSRTAHLDDSTPKRWVYYYASESGDLDSQDAVQNLIGPIESRNYLRKVYGTRRMIPDYFGPLMRVRNLTTGDEVDVYGGDDKGLSVQTIISLGAGDDVGVVIWYDQSGSLNHAYVEGYYSGTADYTQCPLIGTGNGVKTAVTYSASANAPALRFDGTNDFLIAPPVLTGTVARTVIASVDINDSDGGVANTNNTVYVQPSDAGATGTGFACNIHYHTVNGYQVNANVFGNVKYDTDSTAWDEDTFAWTFPAGGNIEDIQAYQGGTALPLDVTASGTSALNTDNNTVRIGAYYLNETTASYSDYLAGDMVSLVVYEEEKDTTFLSNFNTNADDFFQGNDGAANTEPGVYARNSSTLVGGQYAADADYGSLSLSDYGAISNKANKRFNLAADNVTMEHIEQGGDVILSQGSTAVHTYAESAANQGYTKMVMENQYVNGPSTVWATTTTHAKDEPTNADEPYVAPTVEGPKHHAYSSYGNQTLAEGVRGLRRSAMWKKEAQLNEIEYYGGLDAMGSNPWWSTAYNNSKFAYNGRYIGHHPQENDDLNLEAGTQVEFSIGGKLKLTPEELEGNNWREFQSFIGCQPVFRARVEVEDKEGNKWRLFRPVRTYDHWGSDKTSEHRIPLDNHKPSGSGWDDFDHEEWKNTVEYGSIGSLNSALTGYPVGLYIMVNAFNTAATYYWNGSNTTFYSKARVDSLSYYAKKQDDNGDPTFGNWIPHPDNTAGTTGSTTEQWEDAWYEALGMDGESSAEHNSWDYEPTQLTYHGWQPMLTKYTTEEDDDSNDVYEKLKFDASEGRDECYVVSKFTAGLPGTIGETEIRKMTVETGLEIFSASQGPRPQTQDATYPNGRFAKTPVDDDGKLTALAILRTANADGSGGYCNYHNRQHYARLSTAIESMGVVQFSAKTTNGNSGTISYKSFANGGVGEEALSLGKTVLGSRYVNNVGTHLGKITGYLMDDDGNLDQVGYWKLKWRHHHDGDSLATAIANNKVFTSLHELVTWDWLNYWGFVRKKLMVDVLPTQYMNVSGPIAPHLPLQQDNLLDTQFGISSKVMPGKVSWSMAGGNKFDGLELYEYTPLRPDTVGEGTTGAIDGTLPPKPVKNPNYTPTNPVLGVTGADNATFFSFPGVWGQMAGASFWADPTANFDIGWDETYGSVEILRAGAYTFTAGIRVKPNVVGNHPYLEVHTGTTSNFTVSGATLKCVLDSDTTGGDANRESVLKGSRTIYLTPGTFVKVVVRSDAGTAGSTGVMQRTTEAQHTFLDVVGASIIQVPDFGDAPNPPNYA